MLTREAFERQAAWPQERVHGWAPGNYSCTCGDCGIHYVGDKRSVQCYPCAAKFVPPPRPETIEEIRADRDALRAELDRTKGEMEEVKYDLAKFQRSERVVSEMLIERTLDAENLRRLLAVALPHVEASAGAEHLFDGFRPRGRPLDATVEAIRAALERKADA